MSTTAMETRTIALGSVEQIPPGEGRSFRVAGEEIAVFRTRTGDLYATQARCPHRDGPLADGLVGAGRVVCPFHSYAFDLATGEPVRTGCPALRTYAVELTAGGEMRVTVPQQGTAPVCG